MTDVFTKEKRSEVMSRIRSRGNLRTELRLMEIMRGAGITGWRCLWKGVSGTDAEVLPAVLIR